MVSKKSAALVLVALLGAAAAQAHHSFSSTFDAHKPIEITGVITKVEWINPHSYVHMDVKDKSGKTVPWAFESLPPAMFKRAGLKKEMLPIGSTVTITGFGAKDGTQALGWIKKFKFADGREIQVTADNPSDANFVDVH
ncbi:MAG: DUF6152 family protein [Steroidobacteraceae bacterium]